MQILGVSTDTVDANAAFADKFQLPYPLLCDTERRVCSAYGACDGPDTPRAKRITYVIGPDGHVLQAHAEVDPREHPEALLASLV